MNLAWHHFRKDARQFWVFLGLWFGLLLLDFAVNQGWVGRVEYNSVYGFDRAANTWTGMLSVVIWALIGLVPSLVVLADSPARREGFLATRPLPKRALCLAKTIFVLGLVVVPWVLQELVHLVWQGMPAWVVERGTCERLLVTLPVAFGCAAFAALWPSPARWARALGVLVVCYIVTGVTVSFCINYFHIRNVWTGPGTGPLIVGFYSFVLALVTFTIWHSRAYHGALVRWGGLILVAVISQWAATFWPGGGFKLQPANQAAAKAVMAQVGFEIPPHAVSLRRIQDADGAEATKFNVMVVPQTKPLPAGQMVEWAGQETKLTRAAGGEKLGGGKIYPAQLFSGYSYNPDYHPNDFIAWAAEFPADVLFRQGMNAWPNTSPSLDLQDFKLPSSPAELAEPLTLQASLEARVFQWRKIADLPLTPGATATDEFGSWKFVATKLEHPTIKELYLERRQISLSTAANSRCSGMQNGPLTHMACMVYDPVRHLVWLPSQGLYANVERGAQTVLPQYFITVSFYNSQSVFTATEAARCRLIVFEKTWVGSVPEAWSSASFTLDEKLQSYVGGFANNNNQRMPRDEFARRIAALKTPAPDASRRDVSLYLLEFLRLVDAQRFTLPTDDPVTLQLARLVPAHLDLLLDGLPAMSYAAQSSVLNAIKLGATETQKPVIIAALQKFPGLAEVLLARDWVAAARPELYQLLKFQRALPLDAMRAIASFRDPQTYPRLLEEFAARPTTAADSFLRTLPGLEPELDAIIARRWHAESLVVRETGSSMFDDGFRLALRQGELSALQRAYQVMDDPALNSRSDSINLAGGLAEAVQMPGLKPEERYDSDNVLAWMRQHRPEDFVFSPARRQFVLKPSARETVSAQKP